MKLQRLIQTDAETCGHLLTDEDQLICVTLERPWKNNERNVSCIPAGTYTCKRVHSPHFGCEVFQIMNVQHRDNVLIHFGNYVQNSEGCVLVGTSFADINSDGVMDQTASQQAFKKFMSVMTGHPIFTLTVVDP
jgi:hypothetical protein